MSQRCSLIRTSALAYCNKPSATCSHFSHSLCIDICIGKRGDEYGYRLSISPFLVIIFLTSVIHAFLSVSLWRGCLTNRYQGAYTHTHLKPRYSTGTNIQRRFAASIFFRPSIPASSSNNLFRVSILLEQGHGEVQEALQEATFECLPSALQ